MTIATHRLLLTPLSIDDAVEMTGVLADRSLYRFIGGAPPTQQQLREQYEQQQAGRSPDGRERWHNWIIRRSADDRAVGYVQASVELSSATAEVAWVVGRPWQGAGYASEAAQGMVAWLRTAGVQRVIAYVHPEHATSAAVARSLGLRPSGRVVDDEDEWTDRPDPR